MAEKLLIQQEHLTEARKRYETAKQDTYLKYQAMLNAQYLLGEAESEETLALSLYLNKLEILAAEINEGITE